MIAHLIVLAAVATAHIGGIITLRWWHQQEEEDFMKRYQLDRCITPTAQPETIDFLAWLFVRIMIVVGLILPFVVWFCM